MIKKEKWGIVCGYFLRITRYTAAAPTTMKMTATAIIKIQSIPGAGASLIVKYMVLDDPMRPVVSFAYALTRCDPIDKPLSVALVPVMVTFAAPSKL